MTRSLLTRCSLTMEMLSDCFSISLFYTELYVVNANAHVEELIRSTLLSNVRKLLKSEYRLVDQHRALVFRLKSDISTPANSKSTIGSYKIVLKLLKILHRNGWLWLTSTCFNQNKVPSTLYFKKNVDFDQNQKKQRFVCLCPLSNAKNQLLFMGHNSTNNDAYLKVIENIYTKGIDKVKIYEKYDALVVTLKGYPWGTKFVENDDVLCGKRLMLHLFRHMQISLNYDYYANVSFDGKLNCLFFVKSDNEIPTSDRKFFLISFFDPPETIDPSLTVDQLQLVEAPDHVTELVRARLSKTWTGYDGNVEKHADLKAVTMTLNGHPWQAPEWTGAGAQAAIGQLIGKIQSSGYQLVAPLGSSVCERSINSLIFREGPSNKAPVCTVAFTKRNGMYVMDAPVNVQDTIFRVVNEFWEPRLKHWEKGGPGDKDILLKLSGEPFDQYANTATYLNVRYVMAALIVELEKIGWTILCSSHMTANHNYWPKKSNSLADSGKMPKYDMHSHTWFLVKLS